jgi:serine/threonine-protein phosphatase PGAM5
VRAVAWQRYFVPTPGRDTYDVLVCHGNVIRWTLMRALGAVTKHWSDQDFGYGSLSIIAVRPEGSIRLVMYSDVGHIPVEKQSWSGRGGGWVKPARP